ncbi:MAG: hypothetical protein IJG80_02875 [Selenomonadaceae bacterium]|nr:hypothetical protein [Selenomonadaceae bacterium]
MDEFRLMDLTQLDAISYDEVDKILQRYEETRIIVEHRLKKIGSLKESETYESYIGVLEELPKTKEVKRRISIANQIRDEHVSKEKQS